LGYMVKPLIGICVHNESYKIKRVTSQNM